jgi:hypothetical protein
MKAPGQTQALELRARGILRVGFQKMSIDLKSERYAVNAHTRAVSMTDFATPVLPVCADVLSGNLAAGSSTGHSPPSVWRLGHGAR